MWFREIHSCLSLQHLVLPHWELQPCQSRHLRGHCRPRRYSSLQHGRYSYQLRLLPHQFWKRLPRHTCHCHNVNASSRSSLPLLHLVDRKSGHDRHPSPSAEVPPPPLQEPHPITRLWSWMRHLRSCVALLHLLPRNHRRILPHQKNRHLTSKFILFFIPPFVFCHSTYSIPLRVLQFSGTFSTL